MGPKKNIPKNAFALFMEDQKKVFESKKIRYEGMKHLAELCSPKWNSLGEAEKTR